MGWGAPRRRTEARGWPTLLGRASGTTRARRATSGPGTLRARPAIDWLRTRTAYRALEAALTAASSETFRVVHFSVQTDHLHLIVEADSKVALSRGMRGLAIRCALAVNRAVHRTGAVWGDRYHANVLRTPRMVRNALVYVLANARKHLRVRSGLDPCSSARWFDGFVRDAGATTAATVDTPTHEPRTWLLRVGWRRHGLIHPDEAPAPPPKPARRLRVAP